MAEHPPPPGVPADPDPWGGDLPPHAGGGIDVARARAETPGCAHVAHFNNAGAALMPAPVIDAVRDHLELEARIGGYEAEERAQPKLERTYDALAAMIGAHRDEIAVMESATRAWGAAFYSIPFRRGDRVLTSRAEYASNYIALIQVARIVGIQVEPVPDDESGQTSVDALERMLDDRVKLVAITHVPSTGGLVNPAEEIGRVVKQSNALYILDACQSAGQIPLDVDAIGCDFLSAPGRKFMRAPRGTAFLYARRAVLDGLEPPMLDMHGATWTAPDAYVPRDDARRFEVFEINVGAKIGLGVAADYAAGWGIEAIWERTRGLGELLREQLSTVPRIKVQDLGSVRCGIVTFTVDGIGAEAVRKQLQAQNINVWVSAASSTLLDLQQRGIDELIRASVHYYNSEEEIERLVSALGDLK